MEVAPKNIGKGLISCLSSYAESRHIFPKKTNFDHVTLDELNQALNFINNRPRKCLGWKTAHEAFHEQLLHLI
jgi:IS30 family transposase